MAVTTVRGSEVETPAFCLHCGGQVMAVCIWEDEAYDPYCPTCSSERDEFSREEDHVYRLMLDKWWQAKSEEHYFERGDRWSRSDDIRDMRDDR